MGQIQPGSTAGVANAPQAYEKTIASQSAFITFPSIAPGGTASYTFTVRRSFKVGRPINVEFDSAIGAGISVAQAFIAAPASPAASGGLPICTIVFANASATTTITPNNQNIKIVQL